MSHFKTIYLTLVAVLIAVTAHAEADLAQEAAAAYAQENYTRALELYTQIEREQGNSSALQYNMGNTYYKLKDVPHAIVCYERALMLDPGNSDAHYNLDFVREKSGLVTDDGATFFSDTLDKTVSRMSSNTWAGIALAAFLLCLAGVAVYVLRENVTLRKVGFYGTIAMIAVCGLSIAASLHVRHKCSTHNHAVVMRQAAMSVAPRVPKDSTEVAMRLAPGFTVEIVDSVTSDSIQWLQVVTTDGRNAWTVKDDIEII